MRITRLLPAVVLACSGLAIGLTQAPSAGTVPSALTCKGGNIAPGTYSSITVAGVCHTPTAGTITVTGNLTVNSYALLDDVTPSSSTALPSSIDVGGSVVVNAYGILLLGCDPAISCPNGATTGTIGKNLTTVGGASIVVHAETIAGSVTIDTAGNGRSCDSEKAFATTSLAFTPDYLDLEDNSITGNVVIVNTRSCWMGAIRNSVGGSMTVNNNLMADPDANEVLNNDVEGNVACSGNVPEIQVGDSMAPPNQVAGSAKGQCASTVISVKG